MGNPAVQWEWEDPAELQGQQEARFSTQSFSPSLLKFSLCPVAGVLPLASSEFYIFQFPLPERHLFLLYSNLEIS